MGVARIIIPTFNSITNNITEDKEHNIWDKIWKIDMFMEYVSKHEYTLYIFKIKQIHDLNILILNWINRM